MIQHKTVSRLGVLQQGFHLQYALSELVYLLHIVHQRQHPTPKNYPCYLWLDFKCPAEPWFPVSGNALQRCFRETNSRRGDIINPDTLAQANTSLPAAWCIGRDRLFHWHLVWWIKHQCRLGIEFLNTRAEMLMDHRTHYGLRPSAENALKMMSCLRSCLAYSSRFCGHFEIVCPKLYYKT